jgi:hypothetical protein
MVLLIENDLLVSVGVICTTLIISEVIRRILFAVFGNSNNAIVLRILLEFVAMFEVLVIAYERGILGTTYGVIGWSSPLFLVSLWRSYSWKNIRACPYVLMEEWICNAISTLSLILLIAAELAGGLAAFGYFTKHVWSQQFSNAHALKISTLHRGCHWTIPGHFLEAAGYEAAYAFTFSLLCRILGRFMTTSVLTPVIKAAVFTSLVMHGGLFNPALASSILYGCSGMTVFEHVAVYWVGASFGGLGSFFVWKFIASFLGSGSVTRSGSTKATTKTVKKTTATTTTSKNSKKNK